MHHREIIINNVKRDKRMAEFLGHSNNLITLSHSLTGTNRQSYIIKNRGRPRVNIRLFLQRCKGGRIVFYVPPAERGYSETE